MLEQSRDLDAYSCSLPLSFQEIVYLVLWVTLNQYCGVTLGLDVSSSILSNVRQKLNSIWL